MVGYHVLYSRTMLSRQWLRLEAGQRTWLQRVTRCWRGPFPKTRNPLLSSFARLWQASDVHRPTLTSDVLWRLAIASVE